MFFLCWTFRLMIVSTTWFGNSFWFGNWNYRTWNTLRKRVHTLRTRLRRDRQRRKSQRVNEERERCYDRNDQPTHVHINVLHSSMSPSHRKKGSIYRQHRSTTVPPWSASEEPLVFPFQGLWLRRIPHVYRRDPRPRSASHCFGRYMRCQTEL